VVFGLILGRMAGFILSLRGKKKTDEERNTEEEGSIKY
jgi:hypothetical protein